MNHYREMKEWADDFLAKGHRLGLDSTVSRLIDVGCALCVLDNLRESEFSDLVLPEDANLAIIPRNDQERDYYGEHTFTASVETLRAAYIRVWSWDFSSSSTACEFEIVLDYESNASQNLFLYLSISGNITLGRKCTAWEYAETGYEGHNHWYRDIDKVDAETAYRFFKKVKHLTEENIHV